MCFFYVLGTDFWEELGIWKLELEKPPNAKLDGCFLWESRTPEAGGQVEGEDCSGGSGGNRLLPRA